MPSYLVGGVLYCSQACARAMSPFQSDTFREEKPARFIDPEEFSTEAYGALCPNCEREYEEF